LQRVAFEGKKRIAERSYRLQSSGSGKPINRRAAIDKHGESVMKTLVAGIAGSFLLSILMLGINAQAQTVQRTIQANIAFNFTVGKQTFPAGSYRLVRREPWLLELRDSGGHLLASALTQSVVASTGALAPRLLFTRVGGQPVLTEVWQEDESIGQQLTQTKSTVDAVRKHSKHVQTAKAGTPDIDIQQSQSQK
jgi:hypothetical protein